MDRSEQELEKKKNRDLFGIAFRDTKNEWVHSLRRLENDYDYDSKIDPDGLD